MRYFCLFNTRLCRPRSPSFTTTRPIFTTLWTKVRDSYWFLPSLMAIAAIGLSFVLPAIDRAGAASWLQESGYLTINQPAGARMVLSTVAGSMITVAGTTFSITILAISTTTYQIGPRLLNNFMRNRGNQVTLGVFISNFIYCLLVLRSVQHAESGDGPDLAAAFVPHLAVNAALLFTLINVGVLIYFIHHIPETIHVTNIIADVGESLERKIDKLFPSDIGRPHSDPERRSPTSELPTDFDAISDTIAVRSTGYLQFIDSEELIQYAIDHDLIIRCAAKPGDFVTACGPLVRVYPPGRLPADDADDIRKHFIIDRQRTSTQDLRFEVNQLVEVAVRALSPGVNDPFTATNCIDWLASMIIHLSSQPIPDAHRYDGDGRLRLIVQPETFESIASLVFDQLRPYVSADCSASIHMMAVLKMIAGRIEIAEHRRIIQRHGCALRRSCRRNLLDHRAKRTISASYRDMLS